MAKGDFPYPPDQNRAGKKRVLKGVFYALFVGLVLILSLSLGAAGVAAGYVAALVKDEPVRDRDYFNQKLSGWHQTSYAYFRDESLIGSVRTLIGDRKLVKNDEVSQYLIDALISTEDREFYQHSGIVPRSLLRAVYEDLTNQEVVTGGSTITQQLVKRAILENYAKTYERKAKEILLALRLERMYNKEEILNSYLNSLYFGRGNGQHMYGVQAAAQGIFGVDAKDLNLAQSAYIAGMIQRPNDFNPFTEEGLKRGKKRMEMVLENMLANGKITRQQYKEALAFDIKGSLTKKKQNAYSRYPYIMMAVEERAAEALMRVDGLDPRELSKKGQYQATLQKYIQKVQQGGYHIYTTIDKKLYDAMNKAAKNPNLYAKPITYRTKIGDKWVTIKDATEEIGATLIDVETGALLAFVGGRDFNREQKNHALNSPRQPGSAMKPLLGYGPALDRGVITPGSIIIDEPLRAQGTSGKVYRNATGQYRGPVTAKTALQWSYNIPAIKVFRAVGLETGFDYLRKMNFPVHPYDGEASVIGGLTYGFTVERMTAGYAMFANGGNFNEPYMIEKIVDPSGKTVYEHKPDPVRIMSPQAAYMVTDMLRAVVRAGTAQTVGAGFRGYDLAGKTGTTQNDYDLWFIGYTPKVAMGVWVGYDYNHRIYYSNRAKLLWRAIFQAVLNEYPDLSPRHLRFENPGGLPGREICFECDRQKEFEENEDENNQQDNNGQGGNNGNRGGNGRNPQPPNNNGGGNDGGGGDEIPIPEPDDE